jgi:hypothetical protein
MKFKCFVAKSKTLRVQDCNLLVSFSLLQRKSANLSAFVSVQMSGCNKSIMNFALRMLFVPTSLDLYLISTVCLLSVSIQINQL